jgi:hypothetical protein
MEQYGERIDELDYKIDSSDDETQLNDDDIKQLSDSLLKNDTFQGPLDLSNNNLTDLVSYKLQFEYLFLVMPLPSRRSSKGRCCQYHQTDSFKKQGTQAQSRHIHWKRTYSKY